MIELGGRNSCGITSVDSQGLALMVATGNARQDRRPTKLTTVPEARPRENKGG